MISKRHVLDVKETDDTYIITFEKMQEGEENEAYSESRATNNKLNSSGLAYAKQLIKANKVNTKDKWSFSAEDGNTILGEDDWTNYSKHFLAINTEADKETKNYYKYPFAKNGELYRSGLIAIRQRAGQYKEDEIFNEAGTLLSLIDKEDDSEIKKEINKKTEQMKKYSNTKDKTEKRSYALNKVEIEVREIEGVERQYIIGHASIFNTMSANLGGFYEKVDSNAFNSVLEDDTRALINHNADLILGRSKAGTLSLSVDERGLRYEVEVPETSYAKDLIVSMKRGDITQSSFGFVVGADTWEENNNKMIRTITKIDRLFDVSPVTYPAYPDTDVVVAQRSLKTHKEQQENLKEEEDLHKRSLLKLKIDIESKK